MYAILKRIAPEAEEAIKWGTPFFVEPRFLFAFSAHKAHLNFAPTPAALEAFRKELEKHKTTKGTPSDSLQQAPARRFGPQDRGVPAPEYGERKRRFLVTPSPAGMDGLFELV